MTPATLDVSFSTGQVSRLSGASLRQLQWWDEQGLIKPSIDGHSRVYTKDQVIECWFIVEMRRRNASLQSIRKLLQTARRKRLSLDPYAYLVTDGKSALWVETEPEKALYRVMKSDRACFVLRPLDVLQEAGIAK